MWCRAVAHSAHRLQHVVDGERHESLAVDLPQTSPPRPVPPQSAQGSKRSLGDGPPPRHLTPVVWTQVPLHGLEMHGVIYRQPPSTGVSGGEEDTCQQSSAHGAHFTSADYRCCRPVLSHRQAPLRPPRNTLATARFHIAPTPNGWSCALGSRERTPNRASAVKRQRSQQLVLSYLTAACCPPILQCSLVPNWQAGGNPYET